MGRRRNRTPQGARKLLINASEPEESRIAVLKQGRLDEYYIERQSLGSTLGNVYKAKITNVEKSIGAAFVEFGHGRQGFLHVSDLCMEAVGDDAALLLAGVQAAREVAHDEDVVETEPPAEESSDEPGDKDAEASATDDGGEASADDAADSTDDEAEAPGDSSDGEAEPAAAADDGAPEGEADDDDPLDAEEDDDQSDAEDLGGPGSDDDEPEAESSGPSLRLSIQPTTSDDEPVAGESDEAGESAEVEPAPAEGSDQGDGATAAQADADTAGEDDDARDGEQDGEQDDEQDDEDEGEEELLTPSANLTLFGPLSETAEEARSVAEAKGGLAVADERGGRRGRRGRRGRKGGRNGARGGDRGSERNGEARGAKPKRTRRDARQMPPIEQILTKGQEIVVQVIKDGIGNKGPTLTTYLSIPGRFIVLMPGIHKRGVSRKVTDAKERDRLKDFVRKLEAPAELGFVVRTAGSGCDLEDLQRDLDYLLRLWEQMRSRTRAYSAPVLLYQENDLVIRTLRDLYDGKGDIVTDDPPTAEKAREFLTQIMPDCVDRVQLYKDEKPLFTHYGLEAELHGLIQSRIELKSGGSLIIEQTEALVAIDVNSGRYKPDQHKNIDETAFQVNSEAAVEIARQVRLRDLGGVVVIDFIDMRYEKHRKAVERTFKDELRQDRARIKVARFSPFGIMEMTRQRVRPSLKRTVHQPCPYCDCTGYVPSDETSCLGVIRKVRENLWRPGSVLVVTVRPEVAEAVLNTQKRILADFEESSKKQIFVRADHRLAYEDIEVRAMVTLPDEFDHRRS
jgi:ribonuclease E